MKRNITINMFGSLYAIDEDAYELIKQYLNNMHNYFARQEGGEEVAEDIERRIAELFDELKTSGIEAITIEHVQDIIRRIGNPEEMDATETVPPEAETSRKENESRSRMRKKLFRNSEDKMLSGLCSGLACFFGIDALWIRLLTILLVWLSFGTTLIIYLILWIVVPEDKTPEDRLRMQGLPVNMENLSNKIIENARKAGEFASAPKTRNKAKGCLNGLFDIIATIFKICSFIFIGFIIILLFLFLLALCSGMFFFIFSSLGGDGWNDIFGSTFANWLSANRANECIFFTAIGSAIFVASLTIYTGVHYLMSAAGKLPPMSTFKRLTLACIWCVALSLFAASSGRIIHSFENFRAEERKTSRIQEQLDRLKQNGWNVICHENCSPTTYVKNGEYYTGNWRTWYIDSWASGHDMMKYEVERSVSVQPGVYRLEAAARTDGQGCEIYACFDGKERRTAVPAYGNTKGEIWEEAVSKLSDNQNESDNKWKKFSEVNSGKGYGWSIVEIDSITVHGNSVRYGISNVRSGNWNGSWFSAAEFRLEKIKDLAPTRPKTAHLSKKH